VSNFRRRDSPTHFCGEHYSGSTFYGKVSFGFTSLYALVDEYDTTFVVFEVTASS
jgi:hypothetical protein